MILDVEETFLLGQDTFFESVNNNNSFAVTFEDDLSTGYFYAIIPEPEIQIVDALHIYNVADVVDKDKPSKLQIAWTEDGLIASLLINNYCHAIFDFENKAGYCRNNFPEPNTDWTRVTTRHLTDDLITEFFAKKK